MVKYFSMEEVKEGLKELVPAEELEWLAAEADVEHAKTIILHFKVKGGRLVEGVNILLSYIPEDGRVTGCRVEVLITHEVGAKKFITETYPRLISEGYEVVVKGDGISVFRRLHTAPAGEAVMRHVMKVCNILQEVCEGLEFVRGVVAAGG